MPAKPELALLTNIIAPYRLPIYRYLGERFRVTVIISGREENRDFWGRRFVREENYRLTRAWGFKIKLPRKKEGRLFDYRYLHINPGYLAKLFHIRPDAVLSHEMGFRTLAALAYGTLFHKPVWVGWEGTMHTEKETGWWKTVVRRLIARWCKRWVSYGETSTEYLLSLGIGRDSILQVQNCVDERLFTRPDTGPLLAVSPKPVLLYVGQLVARKGVRHLLTAAAKIQSEGYVFSLLLVGTGPEHDELTSLARQLGLQNVHFHPPVEPEAMAGIYKSADLLVFPTLEDVWGLVVNEALWSGLPVLCSRYAGCARELLPPQNIFDPLDAAEFCRGLKTALAGGLAPPDTGQLKTCRETARAIAGAVEGVLRNHENPAVS